MNLIIDKMRSELRLHCFDAMQAYGNPKPRHEWCFDWSSQLGLVVNQIYWCPGGRSGVRGAGSTVTARTTP